MARTEEEGTVAAVVVVVFRTLKSAPKIVTMAPLATSRL
jgi:hypothetical protein